MDILKNKLYKKYDYISRYSYTPIYYNTIDLKYMYGTTTHLKNTTLYLKYIVLLGDTYDKIALASYNNPTYYWIILDFNRILDPFTEPAIGTELKIPLISAILFEE